MKKLMFIFGTRPEFIKVYPVIVEAKSQGNECIIVNTGQHLEMLNELLEYFQITVDYDLKIMKECNGISDITSNALHGIDKIIKVESPDVVFVHGDTSSTLAGALGAFNNNVKLAHIEAGLRTYNLQAPFPEEANRQMVSLIADYNFAPTETSRYNLLSEGKKIDSIYVVGNTVIDMLRYTIKPSFTHSILEWEPEKKLILMTVHRRENLNELDELFETINEIAIKYHNNYKIVYPIHRNPEIRKKANEILTSSNVKIVEPLDTVNFHNIMKHTHLILTDSGGIQEEAPSLGIPVLVLRDTTERPEGVKAGTLRLVGTDKNSIIDAVELILENQIEYNKMSEASNPFGNGASSKQIIDIINDEK
ncbi:UDP-N-acetylglucosamine 2-epimerase (non-hydrolyzing) [Mollicutes bacterium LVI A0078]|nr:UDP-N-acetylglucosamine 2-epimerase (non-hydrolyzing) [Mollicutes bacterium LVI A0075]WOO90866.1 UDP-N-acetylglucosamine 2-epimerase (non-hydrolyzing) [Mollicutes bacterium LVI A0078]